jgi:hypothetical protein
MIAGLETFAKVRALHDRTDHPGERAAAASRMEVLARSAGMTLEEALFSLDRRAPQTQNFWEDLYASPEQQAADAERLKKEAERRARVLSEVGSEDAVWRKTRSEISLGIACRGLLRSPTSENGPSDTLLGWNGGPFASLPILAREAVSRAYPLPLGVHEAWAELLGWEKLIDQRRAFCPVYSADVRVLARIAILEQLLDTLPSVTMQDLQARLGWMQYVLDHHSNRSIDEDQVCLTSLRSDIERLAVQSGHGVSPASTNAPEPNSATVQNGHGVSPARPNAAEPNPATVQNGQRGCYEQSTHPVHRTSAEKRREVADLLSVAGPKGRPLTDRQIARRIGVSPTTVGNVRRAVHGSVS